MSSDFMLEQLEVKYVYPMYKQKKKTYKKPFIILFI